MKKGYLCEDRKHLNITGENIDGLYDEPYLSSVEWINVAEIADKAALDYSIFKSLKEIIISSLEPYTFPKEICYLPRLEHISCSGACLIPPEIGEMARLQRLDATGDCVLQMPESITRASSLKSLMVSYYGELAPCPMPGWISTLTQLQALYLHLCKFTAIDAAINNLANLETLSLEFSFRRQRFPRVDKPEKIKSSRNNGKRLFRSAKTSVLLICKGSKRYYGAEYTDFIGVIRMAKPEKSGLSCCHGERPVNTRCIQSFSEHDRFGSGRDGYRFSSAICISIAQAGKN